MTHAESLSFMTHADSLSFMTHVDSLSFMTHADSLSFMTHADSLSFYNMLTAFHFITCWQPFIYDICWQTFILWHMLTAFHLWHMLTDFHLWHMLTDFHLWHTGVTNAKGLSLSLPTADMSAVRGSSHYSWASWSRGFVYFLANGVCLVECSKQFFNKFWVVFQADFCILWVKSCRVHQDGVQKVYCWGSSQIFVWIAE